MDQTIGRFQQMETEYHTESYPFQSLIETTYPLYHCEFCHDKHWIIVPDRPNDAHEEPCFCEPY